MLFLISVLVGPEVALAKVFKWGVLGMLVSHQWDVAGEDSFSTSITGGQYFYTVNLSNGWQISLSPTFSYNHEAASGQSWTVPIGFGVSKTAILVAGPGSSVCNTGNTSSRRMLSARIGRCVSP